MIRTRRPRYSNSSPVHAALENGDTFFEQRDPLVQRAPEHRQFLRPVARTDDEIDTPTAREVEHGEVLREPDRVVQRHEERSNEDAQRFRPSRDGAGEHERRRAVTVIRSVMLGERDERKPVLFAPCALLEGSGVERLGGWTERRRAQVVPQ